jgi:hypothetical protein
MGKRFVFLSRAQVASTNVVMDKLTGQSRGFGFVEMTTDEDGCKKQHKNLMVVNLEAEKSL